MLLSKGETKGERSDLASVIMMNSRSEAENIIGEDELLLVGVVVWDMSSEATETSKIRVHRRNVNNGVCTGRDLQRLLTVELEQRLLNYSSFGKVTRLVLDVQKMEIYDKKDNVYVSLGDSDVAQADLAKRFGTRLRIHITAKKKETTDTTMPKPKAIMGRYYSFDNEEGLMIANVALKVHQIENQTVGTGMNVWDGAVLLARYLEKNPALVRKGRLGNESY
jgi:hypothetical protein